MLCGGEVADDGVTEFVNVVVIFQGVFLWVSEIVMGDPG